MTMTRTMPRDFHDMDAFDTPERVRVLGIIDEFRELGINEDLSLPQLVVIGDQSSGKSSLLEGLTWISFPVSSELCTRFATQIVLRRTQMHQSIKVSIIPGPSAQHDDAYKKRLLEFKSEIDRKDLGDMEFKRILDKAAELMGLPETDMNDQHILEGLTKRFSDDILKIEISGPGHHNLSVIDIPGLFHNPTKYQTEEDKEIIRSIITKYIKDPCTIILAVMDARNNLANQEVFHMARAADPTGTRTVGVITKCDALQPGDEVGVMKIAQNEVERLTHGWFAVRNRSTQEIKDGVNMERRHTIEKHFFTTAPWSKLPKDRVGVDQLKRFLGKLLHNHVRKEFPGLVKRIGILLEETQDQLVVLGPSRQTIVERRQYLTRIAWDYQQHVRNSLEGKYDAELDPDHPSKLRKRIRELDDAFEKEMRFHGHKTKFLTPAGLVADEFGDDEPEEEINIYEWIKQVYLDSRGSELPGFVNPCVLETLFRQQSGPWKKIAEKYIDSVQVRIEEFNEDSFSTLVLDSDVREKLQRRLNLLILTAMSNSRNELKQILDDERGGILQTVNDYYANTVNELRKERILLRPKEMGLAEGLRDSNIEGAAMRKTYVRNDNIAVQDIHDALKSYYTVAIKRFMDNVIIACVERHLLGSNGPVKIFTPEFVGNFDDDTLGEIAAENYSVSKARVDIESKIKRLQKAFEIARSAGI